jgi:hypothetical protein
MKENSNARTESKKLVDHLDVLSFVNIVEDSSETPCKSYETLVLTLRSIPSVPVFVASKADGLLFVPPCVTLHTSVTKPAASLIILLLTARVGAMITPENATNNRLAATVSSVDSITMSNRQNDRPPQHINEKTAAMTTTQQQQSSLEHAIGIFRQWQKDITQSHF